MQALQPDPADAAHPGLAAHVLDQRPARVEGAAAVTAPRRTAGVALATVLARGPLPVVGEHLECPVVIAPADDVDGLVLEQLVGLEEVLDLDQPMRPDLLEPLDVLLVGVAQRDAQDLEVEALVVAHLEPADRPRPDVAAGERRLVDEQQGVRVVAVPARVPSMKP